MRLIVQKYDKDTKNLLNYEGLYKDEKFYYKTSKFVHLCIRVPHLEVDGKTYIDIDKSISDIKLHPNNACNEKLYKIPCHCYNFVSMLEDLKKGLEEEYKKRSEELIKE